MQKILYGLCLLLVVSASIVHVFVSLGLLDGRIERIVERKIEQNSPASFSRVQGPFAATRHARQSQLHTLLLSEFFPKLIEHRVAPQAFGHVLGSQTEQLILMPVIGDLNSNVNVYEFLDYNCAWCRKAHASFKAAAQAGQIRLHPIIVSWFGPESELMARFAFAAEQQGRFEQAHSYLLEHPIASGVMGSGAAETSADLPPDVLKILTMYAEALSLDQDRLMADMFSKRSNGLTEFGASMGGHLGLPGTPVFANEGGVVIGYVDAQEFLDYLAANEGEFQGTLRR